MSRKSLYGFKRLRNAIRYSCQGLKAAFQTEPAFKEELLLAAIMISGVLSRRDTGGTHPADRQCAARFGGGVAQ